MLQGEIGDTEQTRFLAQSGGSDDQGAMIRHIVDAQFAIGVAAHDIAGNLVLGEAHLAKIPKFVTGCLLSIIFIRFAARLAGEPQRAPLLERVLAHAHVVAGGDWRSDAFAAISRADMPVPVPALAAAAAAAVADVLGAEDQWVCVAAPLHCVAGMSNVTLADGGLLQLEADAEALAADYNRVFKGSGTRLLVGRATVLLCVFDRVLEVAACDPDDVVGGDVFDFQPTGLDAPRLRRVMSEMDMWLFEHEVNRRRVARGQLPVTGLWLWGGGRILPSLPKVLGWTAGRDPLFAAFGETKEFPSGATAGVLVCSVGPESPEWSDVEMRWLAPALAQLRSGAIDALELSVGRRRYRLGKGIQWRIWRRPRPWWETLDLAGSESNGVQ